MSDIAAWCKEHRINEVEALMPDMTGVARGKIMPAAKYCQEGSAYDLDFALPRNLEASLENLDGARVLVELLGQRFAQAYRAVKEQELSTYQNVISSWEREFLLLNA